MAKAKRIFLVDAHNFLHRAFHAFPPLTTRNGEPTGALYGLAKRLVDLVRAESPDMLAVCFDLPEPTFRHKMYKEYKAQRAEIDPDLIKQLDLAREMVDAMGVATLAAPGYEADDLIATLAVRAAKEGIKAEIITDDKDTLQLVGPKIHVWRSARGKRPTGQGDYVVYDAGQVVERYGVRPDQIVDYLAIVGDASDNIPGVPGIGAVGAAKLLGKYGTLEKIFQEAHKGDPSKGDPRPLRGFSGDTVVGGSKGELTPRQIESLIGSEERVRLGRELIELKLDAPVDAKPSGLKAGFEPSEALVKMFRRLEFNTLLKSLAPDAAADGEPAAAPSDPATVRIRFKRVEPAAWLKEAKGAPAVSLAAEKPAQADLLQGSDPIVALSLPNGRAAVFAEGDFRKHKKALAAILEDPKVAKTAHDLKDAGRVLDEAGITLAGGTEDTMLADYCLNPAQADYSISAVHERTLGSALPPEDAAAGLARRASSLWPMRERLAAGLKADGLEALYRDFELPMIAVLADMETAGIALDAKYLGTLRGDFDKRIAALKAEIDALAGVEINLKSTKQLAEFLYDTLKLPVPHKTSKGGRSTDEDALNALAAKHPVPAKIIDFRELTKLQSTYVVPLGEKLDPKTGRIHSHFNQAGTATGRLSSTDPNLQNIPIRTELGRSIRRAFVAGKGNLLLAADYSQIDLRVLAHLSGDPALCAAFQSGGDIHRRTAAEVFGKKPEEVDADSRRAAKAVNFGIVYGQSAFALAGQLGITRAEAQDIIKKYFERYAAVDGWIKKTLDAVRREGKVSTLLGRVRYLPEIRAKNFQVRAFNERVAVNTPIQGTSADIIKAAMINIHRKMKSSGKWKSRLVLQVHDELIFDLPKKEAPSFGAWVRSEMENAVALKVPVVVDVKTGPDWLDMEALPR